jgi:hypothetical protein
VSDAGRLAAMLIRIEGVDLPGRSCGPSPDRPGGHHGIHVAVQRKNRPDELLGLVPGDAESATWTLACDTKVTADGTDVTGPYISGPPGGRFIYLSWGMVGEDGQGFEMFRRAKLRLTDVPAEVLADAVDRGVLVGRVGLTDAKGNPTCASVRPPDIAWQAAKA